MTRNSKKYLLDNLLFYLYTLGVFFLNIFFRIASRFHPKAALWVAGRKNWRKVLAEKVGAGQNWIWFHCASLGEFEQCRNLIEWIKTHRPTYKILITFFSPSGYEVRKNYALADFVTYLPIDTKKNAADFLRILNPRLVFFVKYELWLNFLGEMETRDIPAILISARVGENSRFLTSLFAPLYKKAFRSFRHIFTQDEATKELLRRFCGRETITASGDTRYDRVRANRESFSEIDFLSKFTQSKCCLICGSTWPVDEKALFAAWDRLKHIPELVMIIAPHEIHAERIQQWKEKYPTETLLFSESNQYSETHRILWVNNIGMLSRLYYYGDVAYVGGGWGSGLHNILEAATFGCAVVFGDKHHKFPEAGELIEAGGGFSVKNEKELHIVLEKLFTEDNLREKIYVSNKKFIDQRSGATTTIVEWCERNAYFSTLA
ncbi:MAG: glycosyltransferase N-terminal domain-containing protein [Bacteroidia bacterium]|nr:glycosyltransferase N-terminal domain-containing protein [Bacteroidia bacterium]